MALASGTRLGPYEIISALGAGGMGEVYRARDTTLNRDVALKVLPPEFTLNTDRVARFEREARLLASLNHPHIGSIYGVELSGTTPALVLELVEGDSLDAWVRRGPLALAEALAIAQQIADALDGTTLYYSFERPLMDGTPEFEIRAATPENAPFRVVARIPGSRVPIWQIVNPALSPDGKWLAQALTDGLTTNLWALSTATGEWRQITDFGDRTTFIARRVSWSSDGRSILAAGGDGDSDIVLLEGLTGVGRE